MPGHKLHIPIITALIYGLGALLVLLFNLSYPGHYHFSLLSESLIQGKAYFIEALYNTSVGDFFMHDASFYLGNYYWPLGPLPAVLLMPFALVGWNIPAPTPEGVLNLIATYGSVYYLTHILSQWFHQSRDRIILTLAFFMGSPLLYITLVPKSWFVAQSLTVFLILTSIHEFLTKRRYGYIGLLFGLIFATRITAGFGIIFFVFILLREYQNKPKELFKKLFFLATPSLLVLLSLGVYNVARFDSPFEQGYRYQLIADQLTNQRVVGLFSAEHIPTNLFYLLLTPPKLVTNNIDQHTLRFPFIKANPWGMSILITSPYLLFLFLKRPSPGIPRTFLIISIIVLLPILFYYGIGFYQFGYRYILDCFPFLFLAFAAEYRREHPTISTSMTTLITCSATLNLFFVTTLLCTKMICEL